MSDQPLGANDSGKTPPILAMTEDERREAERLADSFYDERWSEKGERYGFLKGYAACAEAKRKEIAALKLAVTSGFKVALVRNLVEAERSRSVKLIETLQKTSCHSDVDMVQFCIKEAIAEWEASRE